MMERGVKRLMDVNEAAVYLGRTPEAVRQLIHRGRLPVVRFDKRIFLDRLDIERLIENAKTRVTE